MALLLGLLSAVAWPLVMRLALPVALFTLGLGSFLLFGAAVLALSFAVPGVYVADLGVGGGRRRRRSPRCRAWSAACWPSTATSCSSAGPGGGPVATDGADERPPGVLFLQIDALAYDTARRAVRDGSMPNLAAWLRSGSHTMTSWHTDWSSQTGAAVSGILHGSNHDILGFRWYEKDRDHITRVSHPVDAAEVERRHSDGRGPARRRRRQPRQPVHRRRRARQPDHELAGARRPGRVAAGAAHPGPRRLGLLRLLRQPGERRPHDRRLDRRHLPRAGRGRPRAPRRRPPPGVARRHLPAGPARRHGHLPRRRRLRAARGHAGRALGRLRRLPRLRRGRPPRRAGAGRQPRGAAQHRPAARPAAPGQRAGAAPVPPRRPLRPRPDPGRGVHRTGSGSRSRSWSGGCAGRPGRRGSGT